MPHTLLRLDLSLRFRRFSKYGSPPGPHALGDRDIRIPGAIAGGWICLSGARCVLPVWLFTRRVTFPCCRFVILHTIMPDIDKTFYEMPDPKNALIIMDRNAWLRTHYLIFQVLFFRVGRVRCSSTKNLKKI